MPSKKKSGSRAGSTTGSSRPAKRPARKTVTRRPRAASKNDADELLLVSEDDLSAPTESTEHDEERPEVAVVGQTATPDDALIDAPPMELHDVVLRYSEDIPVAIISLILAASAFLPWYKIRFYSGKTITASGWATGTWGPMVAILGALSATLAILRIRGVRVKLPYPDATIHEAIGWLALIATVVKFRVKPRGMNFHWMVFIAAGAALILAMLAGRMSKISPFATVPHWFRDKAGKIGAALLVVAVGGSVAFGMVNTVNPENLTGSATVPGPFSNPKQVTGKFPPCASKFPRPADASPQIGSDGATCTVSFTSHQSTAQLVAFYKSAYDQQGQKYKTGSLQNSYQGFCLTEPLRGVVYITKAGTSGTTVVMVTYASNVPTICPFGSSQPTPGHT